MGVARFSASGHRLRVEEKVLEGLFFTIDPRWDRENISKKPDTGAAFSPVLATK
jgi:hypothetical protein